MKLKCINNKGQSHVLKYNKYYDIKEIFTCNDIEYVRCKNDRNSISGYYKSRFIMVLELNINIKIL